MSKKQIVDHLDDGDELSIEEVKTIALIIHFKDQELWNGLKDVYDEEGIDHSVTTHLAFLKGIIAKLMARLMMLHEGVEGFQDDANESMDNGLIIAISNAEKLKRAGVAVPQWLLDKPRRNDGEYVSPSEVSEETQEAVDELVKDIKILHKPTTTIH